MQLLQKAIYKWHFKYGWFPHREPLNFNLYHHHDCSGIKPSALHVKALKDEGRMARTCAQQLLTATFIHALSHHPQFQSPWSRVQSPWWWSGSPRSEWRSWTCPPCWSCSPPRPQHANSAQTAGCPCSGSGPVHSTDTRNTIWYTHTMWATTLNELNTK